MNAVEPGASIPSTYAILSEIDTPLNLDQSRNRARFAMEMVMYLTPFHSLFPDLAAREVRTATVMNNPDLPQDSYAFMELYCFELDCDCRRVLLNVISKQGNKHVATISHAFDEPDDDAYVPAQTFLDPMNPQSRYAEALLELFVDVVLTDSRYRARLERHYHMVKEAVADPQHPQRETIAAVRSASGPSRRTTPKVGRNTPCPCGSGKKYKKCCLGREEV